MAAEPMRNKPDVIGRKRANPAQKLDIPGMGFQIDDAGPVKKEAFKREVVEDMKQSAEKSEQGDRVISERKADHPQADSKADDADVFDAVIGQQLLQVMLGDGIHHSENARHKGNEKNDIAEDGIRSAAEKQDAENPVNPGLDHHSGHQGGHTGRRGRMGQRQPGMKRNESRFQPEADKKQKKKRRRGKAGPGEDRPKRGKIRTP